jgi:acetyl esterase/lipase
VSEALPVIVWIHGGAFVSGRKEDVANYARILAGQGFAVVTPDYALAPGAVFPAPVAQINRTLAYLRDNAAALGVDAGRVVLAGDSAGAQIAAQIAAITTSPKTAEALAIAPALSPGALKGVILFCGPYDLALMGGGGVAGLFSDIVGRAYAGRRDWRQDTGFARFTVTDDVTAAYPPAFVSAGNVDPLLPQSLAFAAALDTAGVSVETLFWPTDHAPALGHEYQFDLDRAEGRMALDRAVAFARRVMAGAGTEGALQPDAPPLPTEP